MNNIQEGKAYVYSNEQLCDYFKLVKLLVRLKELKKENSAIQEELSEKAVDKKKNEKKRIEQESKLKKIHNSIALLKEIIKLTTEATLREGNVRLPLEIMRKRYNLREEEVIFLSILAFAAVDPMARLKTEKAEMIFLICLGDYDRILLTNWILDSESALLKNKLIEEKEYNRDIKLGNKAHKFIYSSDANESLLDKHNKLLKGKKSEILSPQEVHARLSKTVIGQERAKKMIAVAAHNHIKRVNATKEELRPGKSNIMLIGPTGSGKTLLARTLAEIMDVPMIIVDASQYSETGYYGEDVINMIVQLIDSAHGDKSRAEKGIIFIDEIDKIAASKHTDGRDVSGKSVQEELLRLLDGTQTTIIPKIGFSYTPIQINLSNVLFIAGGAFPNIRNNSSTNQQVAGFTGSNDSCPARKTGTRAHSELSEDLINYGMIPEFVGRFPILVELSELTKNELLDIISKPSNSILSQYRSLYGDISFSEDALEFIVEQSMKRKVGARGLRAILEETLSPIIFDMAINTEKSELKLTKEDLLKQA